MARPPDVTRNPAGVAGGLPMREAARYPATDRSACLREGFPARSGGLPRAPAPLLDPPDSVFQPVLNFLERFGQVVGRLLMTVVYFVAVAPVALLYKLFSDPLLLKRDPGTTYRPWNAINETVEDARRQD